MMAMPVSPAFMKLRQEDFTIKYSLGYKVSAFPTTKIPCPPYTAKETNTPTFG